MKRLMIVALVALCVAALLPQTLSAGFGIKGGYSLSKFSLAPSNPFLPFPIVNLPSPLGGIFFNLKLGPLAIQPEVLYVRMGSKFELEGTGLQYRMDYIQVPVLLKMSIIPLGPIRPVIYAGGYGAYLLKANGAIIEGGAVGPYTDASDQFEKYDYGVVGGAGIEFKLPGLSFSIEGRYNYGLKNIWIPVDIDDTMAWKNRSMMVLVGIGF
jgi:hypothetical protein